MYRVQCDVQRVMDDVSMVKIDTVLGARSFRVPNELLYPEGRGQGLKCHKLAKRDGQQTIEIRTSEHGLPITRLTVDESLVTSLRQPQLV